MIIKIDAIDTLFFRDGKPFSMGEETWADGIFPPFPSMIHGALRSAYFSNHIDEFHNLKGNGKLDGNDDPTKKLMIKGIYYLIGNDCYLPLPLDCVKEREDKSKIHKVKLLSIQENKNKSSCPTNYILEYSEDGKVENISDGLVRLSMFQKYLSSYENYFSTMKLGNYVLPEPKIGIGVDKKTGTSEEGKLYRVDMKRLGNISMFVDFKGLILPKRGMMKLGGEGKAVSYENYSKNIQVKTPFIAGSRFKIYLSTPAIFKNGWLPEWINEQTLIGEYSVLKLKLLTAFVGKQINIGGFDMKAQKPKPMYKSVPAGSVYYFEIIEGNIQKVFEVFNQTSISELYPEQGFGIVFAGKVKEAV